jgi:hypothetical protein
MGDRTHRVTVLPSDMIRLYVYASGGSLGRHICSRVSYVHFTTHFVRIQSDFRRYSRYLSDTVTTIWVNKPTPPSS